MAKKRAKKNGGYKYEKFPKKKKKK